MEKEGKRKMIKKENVKNVEVLERERERESSIQ